MITRVDENYGLQHYVRSYTKGVCIGCLTSHFINFGTVIETTAGSTLMLGWSGYYARTHHEGYKVIGRLPQFPADGGNRGGSST